MQFDLKFYRGKWAAVWRDETGQRQRRSLRTADRELAVQRLADVRAQANRPKVNTIEAVMKAYIAERDSERAGYSLIALKPFWGALRPDQICPELCRDYIEQRRKAGAGDGTILREMTDMRSAVRRYASNAGASFQMPPSPPPKDRHLTRDEYRALRDAAQSLPHLYLFIELALATGARASAILGLTWIQIDFERNRIDLGIGAKGKGRAIVPMTKTVRRALLAQKPRAESEYVVEYAGDKIGSVKKAFKAATVRAGLDDVTPHVLRHTAAVWMAEAGRPMSEIAQYLGHTSDKVTFRVYARYTPEYLSEAASALEID